MPKEVEGKEFTKVDLDYLVQSSIDNAANDEEIEDEVELFHNALDFADTKVRDCMVPRTEIDAVDLEECSIEQLKNKFIERGHSKVVVYREDIDHIVGYIQSSALCRPLPEKLDSLVRDMPYVPETMAARKLMSIFLQQKKSLGVGIDEFGGTSGLVSLEDIVEEITGDIEDEHDSQKYVAKQLPDGDYMLSGRLEIEKVNELFDLDLPESDDYMTVGGLILHEYQSFPKLNEVVRIGRFEFKIVKNTMTKIELVRLKIMDKDGR
jgi:CBS domain containing-hemolysin-like protein